MPVKTDHDPRGWANVCMRRQEDGKPCGIWYFLMYMPSRGRGLRYTLEANGEPGDEPHVCRDQEQERSDG